MSDSIRMNEGPVQRGNGNGGPTTPKPVILPKGQASARTALTEQQGEGPSADEWDALVARAWDEHALAEGYKGEQFMDNSDFGNALDLVRKELARWGHQPARLRNCPTHGQQPPEAWGCPECVRELREELAAARLRQPTPPAEGEVAQLVAKLRRLAPHNPLGTADPTITRAAELLQQQHPTPVPVSERLPEPKDCDEEGGCWWFDDDDDKWCFDTPYMGARLLCWTHWLPAHAMPLPQGEVEK